jgi:hypothetical protein
MSAKRKYGFGAFIIDVFMTFVTFGFWILWIFARETRNR